MSSAINAGNPVTGSPTTSSVRDNFSFAEIEINEFQRATEDAVTAAGTVDAITANFVNDVVLAEGVVVVVKATGANTITNPTFNADGTGVETIVKNSGEALAIGDIAGNRHFLILRHDSTNNVWVLINPAAGNASTLEGNNSAFHLARANHTGTQAESTIVNLVTDLSNKVETSVITLSTSDPSGGVNGDLWFKYIA